MALNSAGGTGVICEVCMGVNGLHHLQLAMPAGGEARAREFYRGLRGIPEVPKPAPLARRGGCWFERGSLRVHLGVEAEFRPARKEHPAFRVADPAALAQRLRSAGREHAELQSYERFFVADPFGNRSELLEAAGDPRE